MIILGNEPVEGSGTMAAVTSHQGSLDERPGRCHPAPEVSLVHAMPQYMFVGLLELGQGEELRQQVEGDVGVTELGLEAERCVIEDHLMNLVVDLEIDHAAPVHPVIRGTSAATLAEERDKTHGDLALFLALGAQGVQLLNVLGVAASPLANDPPCGFVERLVGAGMPGDQGRSELRVGAVPHFQRETAQAERDRDDRQLRLGRFDWECGRR